MQNVIGKVWSPSFVFLLPLNNKDNNLHKCKGLKYIRGGNAVAVRSCLYKGLAAFLRLFQGSPLVLLCHYDLSVSHQQILLHHTICLKHVKNTSIINICNSIKVYFKYHIPSKSAMNENSV